MRQERHPSTDIDAVDDAIAKASSKVVSFWKANHQMAVQLAKKLSQ